MTGLRFLALFFLFGTTMCALTIVLLAFPGSALEPLWRLNPAARDAFQSMNGWAFAMMTVVGAACLLSAIGLLRNTNWGRRLAIAVLTVNVIGDVTGAVVRKDPRTLIGLPIAGLMIWYLATRSPATAPALRRP